MTVAPSVTDTDRSAVALSVSVAVLLPGLVSNPSGGVTVTVLLIEPVADGLIRPTAVKVALPPGSRVTGVRMLPAPLAAPTLDPAGATAVQGKGVMTDGNRSLTCALMAVLGPLLLTTMM